MRPLRSLTHLGRAGSALGACAAVALGAAAPAAAAPTAPSQSCSIVAPAHVVVQTARPVVTFTLASDCPVGSTAQWNLVAPGGAVVQQIQLNSGQTHRFRPGPRSTLGRYTLRPVSANDTAYDQLVQNSPTFTIGTRTITRAAASRAGRSVVTRATVTTYDRAGRRFLPRRGATVRLQRSACATACPWLPVTSAKTNAAGVARLSARVGTGTYLRVYTDGTTTAWGTIGRAFRK